jgi:hypothetical protein
MGDSDIGRKNRDVFASSEIVTGAVGMSLNRKVKRDVPAGTNTCKVTVVLQKCYSSVPAVLSIRDGDRRCGDVTEYEGEEGCPTGNKNKGVEHV